MPKTNSKDINISLDGLFSCSICGFIRSSLSTIVPRKSMLNYCQGILVESEKLKVESAQSRMEKEESAEWRTKKCQVRVETKFFFVSPDDMMH